MTAARVPQCPVAGPADDPLRRELSPHRFGPAANWSYRPSFFDGRVGICAIPDQCREADHGVGDIEDHGLDEAVRLLQDATPDRYEEFAAVVAVVHPVTHACIPPKSLCSNSGASTVEPPGIYLTVTHPAATAEALVHEMAHHKLFGLGVTTDTGGRLLRDTGVLAYSAAVERERPIPAILHAAYSFLHMVEFNIACRNRGLFEHEMALLLPGNLRVSSDTVRQLQLHAKATPEGFDFLERLYRWADALFSAADER